MAINTLSLPVDIPWKRVCVSADMIDEEMCDAKRPPRWRSSVAIFSYEPPDEHQTYEQMTVSYLKVACTITGFQHDHDISVGSPWMDYTYLDADVITDIENTTSKYYGCYGAILEVSVKPAGDAPKGQYPYFINFEPKRREVYELVSESGDMLSRSLDEVNIQKGATTTVTNEVIDKGSFGWELSPQAEVAGGGGKLGSLSGGSENTTRNVNQAEQTNLRTTDRSREMREQYSHTTQLTQMYHEFTAYHLGSNRALFFMLPRPHIVQSEHTFVRGPRLLEGIQEVLLVVMRPKGIPDICVEAYLETAHLTGENVEKTEIYGRAATLETRIVAGDVNKQIKSGSFLQLGSSHAFFEDTFKTPQGFQIDLSQGDGGYKVVEQSTIPEAVFSFDELLNGTPVQMSFTIDVKDDAKSAKVSGVIGAYKADPNTSDKVNIWYPKFRAKVIFYLKPDSSTLWLTGRGVCCCPPITFTVPRDSVSFEQSFHGEVVLPSSSGMSIREANLLRGEIGRMIIQSVNSRRRYPRDTITFREAQFIARRIATLIDRTDHPDNQAVAEIVGLDSAVIGKITSVLPRLRRADVLRMQLQETEDRFGLSHHEAVHLRRAALGVESPAPEPSQRWDPPARRGKRPVPNVIGSALVEAQRSLVEAGFKVGEIAYQDSEQPHEVVIGQSPDAGEPLRLGAAMDLIVASGLTVRIPDIEGRSLSEVLCLLRDAGLRSEPELRFVSAAHHRHNQVTKVTPTALTYVTPNAKVVLHVASEDTH